VEISLIPAGIVLLGSWLLAIAQSVSRTNTAIMSYPHAIFFLMNKLPTNTQKDSKTSDSLVIAGIKYVPLEDEKAVVPAAALVSPLTDRALSAVRGAKLRPITVTIPYSQAFGCDASGTSAVTADVTPWSNTTEWAAWTTLYSEFRMIGARFDFATWIRQSTPPFQSQHMLAIGFDPTSSALPAGSRQICELSQHKLLAPELQTAGAAVAADVYAFRGGLHTLRIKAPKGPMLTGSGVVYTSAWTATATPIPFGAIKMYVQTSNVSTNIVVGMVYCRVEFRSRAM
jgi:hypothetical protein